MDSTILKISDALYPPLLREIKNPPQLLYCAGDLSLLKTRCVAVVGSRKITAYGRRIAAKVAGRLAACGVTVVSGMAIGIDGISHRSALDAGGKTIAVLGNGLDVMYPAANRDLKKDILRTGLLLSEYPPGTRGTKFTFPQRNRIISGLSEATVVIEAGLNSGSLITAALANEQGRPVYGVPGNIDNVTSLGVNMLIRDGAQPLIAADDLLADLQVDRSAVVQQELKSVTGAEEQQILALLARGSEVTVDQLAAMTGLTAGRINGLVSVLEMKGLVMTALGRVFLAV
jgi:DNA processing protein